MTLQDAAEKAVEKRLILEGAGHMPLLKRVYAAMGKHMHKRGTQQHCVVISF